jgi:EmrB/QacA subfamily drug resistance transporter
MSIAHVDPGARHRSEHRPTFCAPEARPWILASAILASAMGFIDGSVTAIALPAMREGLDATLAQGTWINNAYLLPLSALILVGGAIGDRYGVARVFGVGIALFVAASVVVALSPTAEVLIAARALKGMAAALMVPGSLAIIAKAYPRAERGRAIGVWAAASAVTTALGPVLGGALLSALGSGAWRIVFALNLPLGLFALWILWRKVGQDRPSSLDGVDWLGGVLATLGLGALAWSLTALQSPGDTPLPPWALAAIGVACLAALIAQERRARHPMMPLRLFADRGFSAANAATFLLYFGLGAILFYLPQTVIAGWGRSEAEMSLIFVPFSALMATVGPWAGRLSDRIGPGPLIGIGAAIVAVVFAALGLLAPQERFWLHVLPLMTLMGLGMSLVVSPLSAAVMGAVDDASTGAASGINNAVSRMAGLVAVAAMGAVAATAYAGAGGPASFGEPVTAEGHGPAMNAAFAAVAYVCAALCAAASATAFLAIPRPPHATA